MNPEHREQVTRLYHAAMEREPKDRGKFIAEACEGDIELRRELESLLADTKTADAFLEKPAIEFAAPSLVDDNVAQLGIDGARPEASFEPHGTEHVKRHARPPWWMYAIAAAFLAHAAFITYFCFFGPESMGIEVKAMGERVTIRRVASGSPAERAGILRGDRLLRANNRFILDANYWFYFLTNVKIAQPFVLETERQGQLRRTVLVLKRRPAAYWSTGAGMVLLLNLFGQFTGLAIACFLAFLRPKDPLACIGALFLAIYSTAVFIQYDGFNTMWRHWPFWYQVLLWGVGVLNSVGLGVFFTFFALFPRPSFRNKWIWVAIWVPMLLLSLVFNYQIWHFIYSPDNMLPSARTSAVLASVWVTYLPGSFILLAVKYRRLDKIEKRRVRLIVVAFALLVVLAVPVLVYSQPDYSEAFGASLFLSLPVGALATLVGVAFPLCFAYAILRHRLFDIRIIIRQGIRYAAAKQLLLLAVPAIILVFLADIYAHRNNRVDTIVQDRGWIYLGLAALAILAHIRRNAWLRSLDRRFFREQYNAQEILRTTLERVSTARSLAEVAPIVVKQIEAAMHPLFCAIVEHDRAKRIYDVVSIYPEGVSRPPLGAGSKAVELAKLVAKPVQLTSDDSWLTRQLPWSETQCLEHAGVDLIAPVKRRGNDALIVLGRKRSEEPYTSDDMRLLEGVAIGLALLPSQRFPEERFKLESRIGQGGMGLVYEATDLQLARKVAIKFISENLIADSAALDRFQREARILASFQHPNVVTLFDVGVMPDGRPFLVMERLQGRTLRDELNCRTRLPGEEIRPIVRQLCAALSAAHGRSLIHRDLKPENIFLCEDAPQRLVKVLDFGLAKLFLETSTSVQTTLSALTGQVIGTPAYMAPELLLGAKPERDCDIWALAIVTYEMLTGHRPSFGRGGPLADSSDAALLEPWHDFFDWSLARDPSQRPESVEVFLARFERLTPAAGGSALA